MGQFKPMVKMETTEPSVILKLKKGGKVAPLHQDADGHTNMKGDAFRAKYSEEACEGDAPKKPSMAERRKAMSGALLNSKKGGKAMKHDDAAQDRAMIKKAMAGKKFADGGNVTASMAKTTVKGNTGKFVKTKVVDGDKNDSAKGTKGVKTGNSGGYAMGGTIEGNAGKFLKTKVVDGDKNDSAKSTGKAVKMGNNGGYATGGTIKGGSWENRPADTAKAGKSGGTTGGVRNGNAGGYKTGGAAKKHFATGGNVVSDGRAVAMPKKALSQPVSNSRQSGTFKKGGNVKRFADGGIAATPGTPSASSAPTLNYGGLNIPPSTGNTTAPSAADMAQIALIKQQKIGQPPQPDAPPINTGGGMGQLPMGPGGSAMSQQDINQQAMMAAQKKAQMQNPDMMGDIRPSMGGMGGGFGGMQPPMGGMGNMHGRFGSMRPPMGGGMGGGMGRPQPMPVGLMDKFPMPISRPQPMPLPKMGGTGGMRPLPSLGEAPEDMRMYKRGGKVSRYRDGDSVGVDPTPSNSSNMRKIAKADTTKLYDDAGLPDEDDMKMARAIRRFMGLEKEPAPTEKQSIHSGGFKKGGKAKR